MKKSLLDIQQEIRSLEGKVKDLSTAISSIYEEIDELRNAGDDEGIDFDMIRLMSGHLTFGKHPLGKLNGNFACQTYIKTLLSLVHVDRGSDCTVNRLIFIQYILTHSLLKADMETLFKSSLAITADSFKDIAEALPKQYRNHLIVDCLITGNIAGRANDGVLEYIASLCAVLGADKETLRMLSIVARGVLKQDLGQIQRIDMDRILDYSKDFKHYLDTNVSDEVVHSQRVLAVEVPDQDSFGFKWKVKQYAKVEKGDPIAEYRPRSSGFRVAAEIITAPCAGTVFQFRNNNTNYGVIGHEKDNKDSIKAWVIKKR